MCGIAGSIERNVNTETLAEILACLAQRGPDDHGLHFAPSSNWEAGFGHRRLSIIDIAGGKQPMLSGYGCEVLTYNGEIYNFRELRSRYEAEGLRFRSRSDTEVLLEHMRRCFQATPVSPQRSIESSLTVLNGMFAFALWNPTTETLLLARDRMGIKPLYYGQLPSGGLVFASELHALLKHPEIQPAINLDAVASYFFSDYTHAPSTMLAGVRKLPPAHYLLWRNGRVLTEKPYWSLNVGSRNNSIESSDNETLPESCWRRIGDAVKRHLVADVPLGVLLSGGLDSSSVAVLANNRASHNEKAEVNTFTQKLQTFSIGFQEKSFDESMYAKQVADSLGTEHHHQTLGVNELLDLLDDALANLDEPIADHAYLPMYALCKLASQHVKVVLSGDGGDEIFGGYPTYKAHRYSALYAHLPNKVHQFLKDRCLPLMPVSGRYQSLDWRLRHFIGGWDNERQKRHLSWMASTGLDGLRSLLPTLANRSPATLSMRLAPTDDPLNAMLALDLGTYLPGSILAKVDRASMAHGLEVRPPLLDNELVEWCYHLPAHKKLTLRQSKFLLKNAAQNSLPKNIIYRPKRGFGMPVVSWLRGPLNFRLEAILRESPLWDLSILSHDVIKRWKQAHLEGLQDHSKTLWALIVLDNWVRRNHIVRVSQ